MSHPTERRSPGMRIEPVSPPYDQPTAALLAKWMPPGVDAAPLMLFRVLARHPELADRLRPMASGLLNKGMLPARDREVMVGRTTARAGAEYEWGVHAAGYGPAVGLADELLDALVTAAATDDVFDDHDALLVRAADELYDDACLTAATFDRLSARYDAAQLLELCVLCGWYRTLSAIINSVRLPSEPWGRVFPR